MLIVIKYSTAVGVAVCLLTLLPDQALAGVLGEYSFLHVTFNSVWHVFLLIFALVMVPFALIIIMSWRFRESAKKESGGKDAPHSDVAQENGKSE